MAKIHRGMDARASYALAIKNLKKELPKACTFLSPFTNRKGQNMLKYIVNGETHYSSIPANFTFTKADFDELRSAIISKV